MSAKSGPKTVYAYRTVNTTVKLTPGGVEKLLQTADRLQWLRGDVIEALIERFADQLTIEPNTK